MIETDITELSKKAIADAKLKFDVELDYSEESIESVNAIIQKMHDKGDFDLSSISLIFGAYIGEVIIRNSDECHWDIVHTDSGSETYRVNKSGSIADPFLWAKKHLKNGHEDNLSFKYSVWKDFGI